MSNGPSSSDLENLKTEILTEMRSEMQKMKLEIIEGKFYFVARCFKIKSKMKNIVK